MNRTQGITNLNQAKRAKGYIAMLERHGIETGTGGVETFASMFKRITIPAAKS